MATHVTHSGVPAQVVTLPATAARQDGPAQRGAAHEFLAWAREHQRSLRRHGAEMAQITRHHDPGPESSAVHQLQAWALRQTHERHLHDSAIAALRHH